VTKELIIDAASYEIDIALLEDKRLVELSKEKSNPKFSVGDIYLGRVRKIMPGLNAAFIDVGFEKDAFLHYLDLGPQFRSLQKFLDLHLSRKGRQITMQKFKREKDIDKKGKISDVLTSGKYILVQIAKEPISTKGPRLTSEITLAGRNMVLMPFSDKISVSQKIKSEEERKRLRTLIQSIRPNNYGVIVRTVAENKMVKVLDEELRGLVKKWESAFERLRGVTPPALIVSEINRTSAILRDILSVSFNSIYVNDETVSKEIREYISTIAPEKSKIVNLYTGSTPIFEKFGIEKQIKASFGKTVSFKSGAYLIIEHTEALHVIDVNSGNRAKSVSDQETNALEVNLAAVDEIARQLRLRDMGGIIVIDFIDMHLQENKNKIFERMRQVMEEDRTKHSILPLSKFGLMQITRQRVRPEMEINTREKCPTCAGTGEISPSVLLVDKIQNSLTDIINREKLSRITLKLHPYVAAYITKGWFTNVIKKWKKKLHCRIRVVPVSSYDFLQYKFFGENDTEILS